MNTEITIDELISSYQKELGILLHSKIVNTIQIERLNLYIKSLEDDNNNLKNELIKLKSKKPRIDETT